MAGVSEIESGSEPSKRKLSNFVRICSIPISCTPGWSECTCGIVSARMFTVTGYSFGSDPGSWSLTNSLPSPVSQPCGTSTEKPRFG